jgi:hypothetical protein
VESAGVEDLEEVKLWLVVWACARGGDAVDSAMPVPARTRPLDFFLVPWAVGACVASVMGTSSSSFSLSL